MNVTTSGKPMSEKEIQSYIDRGVTRFGDSLEGMHIDADEEEVTVSYRVHGQPFERIRRITGYLVGTLDRWNNAKRAEESERIKHE